MLASLKRAARTAQVYLPGLVEMKFQANELYCRATKQLFKKEFGGLYHFAEKWRGRLLLDIGGHHGQSIAAFQIAVPECEIISFEANPGLSVPLRNRYHKPKSAVRIECCALMSAPGSLDFYLPFYNGFCFDGIASTQYESIISWFNIGQFYFSDPKKLQIKKITVNGATLDLFNLEPAFMKLTIQRSELEALKGARQTITKHRPVILVGYPWPDVIEYLNGFGYKPHAYRKPYFIPDCLGSEFTWFLLPEHDVPVRARRENDHFPQNIQF